MKYMLAVVFWVLITHLNLSGFHKDHSRSLFSPVPSCALLPYFSCTALEWGKGELFSRKAMKFRNGNRVVFPSLLFLDILELCDIEGVRLFWLVSLAAQGETLQPALCMQCQPKGMVVGSGWQHRGSSGVSMFKLVPGALLHRAAPPVSLALGQGGYKPSGLPL